MRSRAAYVYVRTTNTHVYPFNANLSLPRLSFSLHGDIYLSFSICLPAWRRLSSFLPSFPVSNFAATAAIVVVMAVNNSVEPADACEASISELVLRKLRNARGMQEEKEEKKRSHNTNVPKPD